MTKGQAYGSILIFACAAGVIGGKKPAAPAIDSGGGLTPGFGMYPACTKKELKEFLAKRQAERCNHLIVGIILTAVIYFVNWLIVTGAIG